jgi:hypothetical protein
MADVPVITNLVLVPGSGPAGSQVVVRLHLFDRQGIGNILPLLYEVREGIEESRVPIYDNGRNGDLLANDNFFAGRMTIPLNLVAGPHWFVVFLFDREGHRSNLYNRRVYGDEYPENHLTCIKEKCDGRCGEPGREDQASEENNIRKTGKEIGGGKFA